MKSWVAKVICTPLVAEIFVGAFVPVDSVGMLRLPGTWFLVWLMCQKIWANFGESNRFGEWCLVLEIPMIWSGFNWLWLERFFDEHCLYMIKVSCRDGSVPLGLRCCHQGSFAAHHFEIGDLSDWSEFDFCDFWTSCSFKRYMIINLRWSV